MNTIHFTGIGGSGAFYLAKYFLALGKTVTGSDIKHSERTQILEKLGAKIYLQPLSLEAKNSILNPDLYIYSPALPKDHPEVAYFLETAKQSLDVGQITSQIIGKFEQNALTEVETQALKESELIPLMNIAWSDKKYVAVTGTDGKTTTSTFVYHLLSKQNVNTALISTLGVRIGDKFLETGLHTTTPTSQELAQILKMPEMQPVKVVVLETTSHALAMGRIAGAKFDAAIITNITGDHLDYHGDYEHYLQAKADLLLKHLKTDGVGIVNPEDEIGYQPLLTLLNQANINFVNTKKEEFDISLPEYMQTSYNLSNAAQAALAVNHVLNKLNLESLTSVELSDIEQISGRMEIVQSHPFKIIVDFAHTANGLKQVVSAVAAKKEPNSNLHLVFGCAGMRDRTKRQPMGLVAYNFADYTYICPEDPRLETLPAINSAILKGMNIQKSEQELSSSDYQKFTTDKGKSVEVFQEFSPNARKSAIKAALHNAKPGDIVLITGKSHEKSMAFGTEELDWNDFEAIKEILQA